MVQDELICDKLIEYHRSTSLTGLFPEITISHNIYVRPGAFLICKIVNNPIKRASVSKLSIMFHIFVKGVMIFYIRHVHVLKAI